jgi:hypothetical protein
MLLVLVPLLLKQDSWPQRGKERPVIRMYCAWYIHRAGDNCANLASSVYGQGCGPMCIGTMRCNVREVRQWRGTT